MTDDSCKGSSVLVRMYYILRVSLARKLVKEGFGLADITHVFVILDEGVTPDRVGFHACIKAASWEEPSRVREFSARVDCRRTMLDEGRFTTEELSRVANAWQCDIQRFALAEYICDAEKE